MRSSKESDNTVSQTPYPPLFHLNAEISFKKKGFLKTEFKSTGAGSIHQLCGLHIPMGDISLKHAAVTGHTPVKKKRRLQVVMETLPTAPRLTDIRPKTATNTRRLLCYSVNSKCPVMGHSNYCWRNSASSGSHQGLSWSLSVRRSAV